MKKIIDGLLLGISAYAGMLIAKIGLKYLNGVFKRISPIVVELDYSTFEKFYRINED